MLFLIVYDIGDDRVREKFSKTLMHWGLRRIQRSAFIGNIVKARARDMARYASTMISLEQDIVHIIPIDKALWREAFVVGTSRWSGGLEKDAVIQT